MARGIQLEAAISEYLASRRAGGARPNTLRNLRNDLTYLLVAAGNIPTTRIDGGTVDIVFTKASGRRGPAALNNLHGTLNKFFKWLRARNYMDLHVDPLVGFVNRKVPSIERRRVPLAEFPALLDACHHPRDRMVVALGLFLFLRQSEIASLKISDVDLDSGEVLVTVHKAGGVMDRMPISRELDTELRRWFTFYTQQCGPLDDGWMLCPAKRASHVTKDPGTGRFLRSPVATDRLVPTRPMVKVEDVVKRALVGIGWSVTGENREGVHTLRRSGARAMFDELTASGYDGALRAVQVMLHHQSGTMTEKYLGLTLDKQRRNTTIRGKDLFPSLRAATPLRAVMEG
jgi:integrase